MHLFLVNLICNLWFFLSIQYLHNLTQVELFRALALDFDNNVSESRFRIHLVVSICPFFLGWVIDYVIFDDVNPRNKYIAESLFYILYFFLLAAPVIALTVYALQLLKMLGNLDLDGDFIWPEVQAWKVKACIFVALVGVTSLLCGVVLLFFFQNNVPVFFWVASFLYLVSDVMVPGFIFICFCRRPYGVVPIFFGNTHERIESSSFDSVSFETDASNYYAMG